MEFFTLRAIQKLKEVKSNYAKKKKKNKQPLQVQYFRDNVKGIKYKAPCICT